MGRPIAIKEEREFGDILGDGLKIVFRNLKPILSALLIYVVPFFALALVIIIFSGVLKSFSFDDPSALEDNIMAFSSSFVIIGLGMGLAVIMINLVVYAAIIDYYESDGNITFPGIQENVKKHFLNYITSIGAQLLIIVVALVFLNLTFIVSAGLFGMLLFFALLAGIWISNIIQFLGIVRIEEQLSVVDGLQRCFFLLKNNWWNTFGIILVCSAISSIMMYIFIIPLYVVIGLLAFLSPDSFSDGDSLGIIMMGVFGILYSFIMTMSYMYLASVRALKYYDLLEKKESRNLIGEIAAIGDRSGSIFENEGEF